MAEYLQERQKTGTVSMLVGIGLVVVCYTLALTLGFFTGFKYIWPPPQEQSILLDFTEETPRRVHQERHGTEPTQQEIDRTKDLDLVQRSESPVEGKKANLTAESQIDEKGDVDVNDAPKPKEINKRALFRSADNSPRKDSLSQQTSDTPTDKIREGHSSGNTQVGKDVGEPSARIKGRSVVGVLPSPKYDFQAEGTVVVKVWVDNYGNVARATAGEAGTTVTDKKLWSAARAAAMQAHFNMSSDAPALQEGTITYVFKLH